MRHMKLGLIVTLLSSFLGSTFSQTVSELIYGQWWEVWTSCSTNYMLQSKTYWYEKYFNYNSPFFSLYWNLSKVTYQLTFWKNWVFVFLIMHDNFFKSSLDSNIVCFWNLQNANKNALIVIKVDTFLLHSPLTLYHLWTGAAKSDWYILVQKVQIWTSLVHNMFNYWICWTILFWSLSCHSSL